MELDNKINNMNKKISFLLTTIIMTLSKALIFENK